MKPLFGIILKKLYTINKQNHKYLNFDNIIIKYHITPPNLNFKPNPILFKKSTSNDVFFADFY